MIIIHNLFLIVLSRDILIALSCNTTEFKCDNGNCIDNALRCNDGFDCDTSRNPTDTSDENNCTVIPLCPELQHRCDSGECVAKAEDCTTISSLSHSALMYTESTIPSLVTELMTSAFYSTSTATTAAFIDSTRSQSIFEADETMLASLSNTTAIVSISTPHTVSYSFDESTYSISIDLQSSFLQTKSAVPLASESSGLSMYTDFSGSLLNSKSTVIIESTTDILYTDSKLPFATTVQSSFSVEQASILSSLSIIPTESPSLSIEPSKSIASTAQIVPLSSTEPTVQLSTIKSTVQLSSTESAFQLSSTESEVQISSTETIVQLSPTESTFQLQSTESTFQLLSTESTFQLLSTELTIISSVSIVQILSLSTEPEAFFSLLESTIPFLSTETAVLSSMPIKEITSSLPLESTVLFSPTESTLLFTPVLTTTTPIDGTQPDDTNDPEFSSLSVVIAIAIVCAILIVLVATVLIRSVQSRNTNSRLKRKLWSHNADSKNKVTTTKTYKNPDFFRMATAYKAKINYAGDSCQGYTPTDEYWYKGDQDNIKRLATRADSRIF